MTTGKLNPHNAQASIRKRTGIDATVFTDESNFSNKFEEASRSRQKIIRYSGDATAGKGVSVKNKKQFGIWMDTHHATVVGHADATTEEFSVLGHAENPVATANPDQKTAQNTERDHLRQFFKKITSHMTNAEQVHVTGTGTAQEQFIHYLAETPQFKNTVAKECTSNKMSDERLVEFISGKFG